MAEDAECSSRGRVALARVLAACGVNVPEDEAVAAYCSNLFEGFLAQGTVEDAPAGPAELFESVQPFVEGLVDAATFAEALAQPAEDRASPGDSSHDGGSPARQSLLGRTRTPSMQVQTGTAPKFVSSRAGEQGGRPLELGAGARGGEAVAPPQVSSAALARSILGSRGHARLDDLVLELLEAANADVDGTVVEYICSVLRDGLDEEDSADVFDGIVGVAPQMEALLAGCFDQLLVRASELCATGHDQVKQRAEEGRHARQVLQEKGESSIRFTLRTNAPSDEEEQGVEEQQPEDDGVIDSPRRAQLREIFPCRALNDLSTALELSNGRVDEAIERMFEIQEFENLCVSADAVSAKQRAELEAFRAATRERALARYSTVAAAEVEEKGKGAVVRPLLKKDDAIDNLRVRAGKKKAEGLRYLDGQVVLVSCVLWL